MSTATELWLFNGLLLFVIAIANIVLQSFCLHLSLARGRVASEQFAGIAFILTALLVNAFWIGASVWLGVVLGAGECTSADAGALYSGVLYGATTLIAPVQARRAGVSFPRWYWPVQVAPALLMFGLGLSCF